MKKLFVLFALLSIAASANQTATTIASPQEGPAPVWSRSFAPAFAQVLALSTNGRCAAVAGSVRMAASAGRVEVLDIFSGRTLWTWEYGKENRSVTAGALTVSPSCDEIVLTVWPARGQKSFGSGYYTWIVNRHGMKARIHTSTTPMGVAFSHKGDLVALGAGGGDILLLRKSGDLKWKKKLIANRRKSVTGRLSGLSFSNDDKFILLQGEDTGVIGVDGTAVWRGAGLGMGAARDLQTFVAWSSLRFDRGGCGVVIVLDGAGKELWHRAGPGYSGAITSSGDKIAAPVYVKQDMTPEECNDIERGSGRPKGSMVELQVFSRSGQLLKSIPFEFEPDLVAISPKGDRLLVQVEGFIEELDADGNTSRRPTSARERYTGFIEELDADGNTILKIPVYSPEYRVPEDFTGALMRTGSMLPGSRDVQVQWFKLK